MSPAERDEDFRQKYLITTARSGEIYGRRRLINYTMSVVRLHAKNTPAAKRRAFVESCLDDHEWLRFHRGAVPHSVAAAVLDAWYLHRFDTGYTS